MNHRFPIVALTAALGLVILQAQGQTPPPSADPYANNPDAGKTKFPLAAPAGKDSGAITKALPSALTEGMLDPTRTLSQQLADVWKIARPKPTYLDVSAKLANKLL